MLLKDMSKRKNESYDTLQNKKGKPVLEVTTLNSNEKDFETRKKQLISQIKKRDICDNHILDEYFDSVIDSVTLMVMAKSSSKLVGFLIARAYSEHIMELVLVCAEKGVGAVVTGAYEDYLRTNRFVLSTLTAIDTAVGYWEKKGYQHVNPGPVTAVKYDLTDVDDKEEWADHHVHENQRKFIIVDDSNHHHDFKYVDEAWNYDGVRMAKIVDYPAAAYSCARTSRTKGCESFRPGGKRKWLFDGC